MYYEDGKVKDLKLAYIGGGSRGWAWQLMRDLAVEKSFVGTAYLYDIDFEAAKKNEVIGNRIKELSEDNNPWKYKAVKTMKEALTGADFVIISILPGTFDEMESDVHTPEKYGIYQSVGDTTGPGGIVRALRTIPMFEEFALGIKKYCPDAWVINYTNPMTVCTKTLYSVFPEIKAFGCCHEVFGTQTLLSRALDEFEGIKDVPREEMKVNVIGINHFTWLTKATYRDIDLFPVWRKFCEKYIETGFYKNGQGVKHWINDRFKTLENVKMDLFLRYGYIAAAGDRHLAEFCPGDWYLGSKKNVKRWNFGLTPVSERKKDLVKLLQQSEDLYNKKEDFEVYRTSEEGVLQIKALLGLGDMVTNVNIPNVGQIPNLPIGSVVETNAHLTAGTMTPVFAGEIPGSLLGLMANTVTNQDMVVKAALTHDLDLAFRAFVNDSLTTINTDDAKKLFDEMIDNTKEYLKGYNI